MADIHEVLFDFLADTVNLVMFRNIKTGKVYFGYCDEYDIEISEDVREAYVVWAGKKGRNENLDNRQS